MICVYVCVYVCMYVFCVCVCVCIYTYVCTAYDQLAVKRASFSLRTLQTAAHRDEQTQASLSS